MVGFVCFRPFRAIMFFVFYDIITQGVTLGLRDGFPFRESFVATHIVLFLLGYGWD